MALPNAKPDTRSDHAAVRPQAAPAQPRSAANPAHTLQAMLEQHYGSRADLPAPSHSRPLTLVEPVIQLVSRAAGVLLFAAALAGLAWLAW